MSWATGRAHRPDNGLQRRQTPQRIRPTLVEGQLQNRAVPARLRFASCCPALGPVLGELLRRVASSSILCGRLLIDPSKASAALRSSTGRWVKSETEVKHEMFAASDASPPDASVA